MSLPELTLTQAVRRQYSVTMRTLGLSFYRNLIFLQLFFCIVAVWATTSYGTTLNQLYSIQVQALSGSPMLWGSLAYVAAMALLMADNRFRNGAFTFVSSRLSYNLANVGVLLTMSAIAAVTSTLCLVLFRVTVALTSHRHIFYNSFRLTPNDLLLAAASVFGYSLLAAAIVYLVVIILRREARLVALIPLGMLLGLKVPVVGEAMGDILYFYCGEWRVALFILKSVLTALALFAAACWGSQGLEVRR